MANKQNYPMYALAILAGVGIAWWTGVPWTFLLFLICPVMMFLLMRGMGGMGGMGSGQRGDDAAFEKDAAAKRPTASAPDGSHDRI